MVSVVKPKIPIISNGGAEVTLASAATVNIGGALSNNVRITGTTTITAFDNVPEGNFRKIRFTNALTLTHNATSLILPSTANITTAAGDTMEAFSLGSGNWRVFSYTRADGKALVSSTGSGVTEQVVHTQTGAVATGTTQIPSDNTIPQNTEGDEYMTLAITPTNASNKLYINVVINLENSGTTNRVMTAALFQDSTADALATGANDHIISGLSYQITFTHEMTAGTTSPTTFKVRAGFNTTGTTTFNGIGGSGLFGGTLNSSITITEITV